MTRIAANALHAWSTQAFTSLGLPLEDATHIARCLVDVDLRGVRSHGTRQLQRYVAEFRDGLVNVSPDISILRETDNSIRLDGDGGSGYLAATRATDVACDKAGQVGLALATTCNHGHVGSAGIYARRVLDHGYISWCVAGGHGWLLPTTAEATVWDAMKAPPMCFAVPADASDAGSGADSPPLVLDMNANQFGTAAQAEAAIAAGFGKSVFGSLGLRFISTLLGGMLGGATDGQNLSQQRYTGANRGFLMVVIDPAMVGNAADFRAEVRRIIDSSLTLRPLAGADSATLPGTMEWRRQSEWGKSGIPIADDHRDLLDNIAMENGLDLPAWSQ
jgi:LDH2 family malate/lactate/ureidoglycolate dehydrogenase